MDLINYCKTTTFFNKTSKRVITYTFANVTLIFRLLHFISHKLHDDKKTANASVYNARSQAYTINVFYTIRLRLFL